MELTPIFVSIRPDENDPNPAKSHDDLVNGARETIAQDYDQVGDYDHVQTVRDLVIVGNLEVPEEVWLDTKERNGLCLSGHGVIIEAEAP